MLTNMIDYLRYALYLVLIVITMTLYQAWDKEHPAAVLPTVINTPTSEIATTNANNNYVPTVATKNVSQPVTPVATNGQIIHITTDVMNVDINTEGGNITQIQLLKYPETLHSTTPFLLLNDNPDTKYVAQSGLLSSTGPDTTKGQAIYQVEKTSYVLADGQNELAVTLTWQGDNGITVTKTYLFRRDSYEVDLNYAVANHSSNTWEGNQYLQLLRKNAPSEKTTKGLVSLTTYFGAAVSSPDKPYNKISFKQMQSTPFNQTITGGWAAMIQHYFVSAWVPENNVTSQYFTKVTEDGLYIVGALGPQLVAQPGSTIETHAKFYAGPSIAERLKSVSPSLPLTIDYGWFWFISGIIFWMMQKIYYVVGNWGWSIVLVTLVIKLLFYQLSAKSYRSMSMLKKLQPRIEQLKQSYGDDKQKFTQATLELYRKEKVNPMSGCLPILIQIPVFIALYWVLIESVQLRQAPWILWIHDLTQKDPYYVLPILMGISMFMQQRLNPPPPDPTQAKVMMLMPVIFTAMFLNFPAGLMLYWCVNNTLSFIQQWYIMRSINNGGDKTKKFVKS